MKLIVLVDGNNFIPNNIISKMEKNKIWFVNTKKFDRNKEYMYLKNTIEGFIKTDKDVMVVKFSGREEIAKELGDECSELIVYLGNKEDEYSEEKYQNVFLDLINKYYMYKETLC